MTRQLALLLAFVTPLASVCAADLDSSFQEPPPSARPHTWWHWMNGNVTKEGITADLEAMQRVGIGGAQAFHVTDRIPAGPVGYLSEAWLDMMGHAIREADRLGLKLCVHNCAGWSSSGGPWITPDKAMFQIVTSETRVRGQQQFAEVLKQPTTRLDYYRDLAVLAFPTPAGEKTGKGVRLKDWQGKAGYQRLNRPQPDDRQIAPEEVVALDSVLDLTNRMEATGRLTWEAPAGDWTVIRFGYTPTGKTNHPAPPEGVGLECDKLSAEAVDFHWQHSVQRILDKAGDLAGGAFNNVLIDSYEVGQQNWTPRFAEEFRRRRGYDLRRYLPTVTGRVVESVDVTERFLWDFRRTIADLFRENYYGRFAELCHQHGMQLSIEPYGRTGNYHDFEVAAQADVPMGEFWGQAPERWHHWSGKLAASAAHALGRRFVGAESFTAGGSSAAWVNHPYALKAQGDYFFCQGVNRFIFHTCVHQPWLNVVPGMTMGPHGFQCNRNNTWFPKATAWMRYLARCQFLLQEGRMVADLAYIASENAPNTLVVRRELQPPPPDGYDYDALAPSLLEQMSVRQGRLVLPSGMEYRALVLPPDRRLRPWLVRRVAELVRAGATVIGPKPLGTPGLEGGPAAAAEVRRLAEEVWGDCDGEAVTSHASGSGRVCWGASWHEVFAPLKAPPDFECLGASEAPTEYPGGSIQYLHRRLDDADVYFVSNQAAFAQDVMCTFRESGKHPELWHPDTGETERAPVFRSTVDGRTQVPLHLGPAGSVFVVFRQASAGDLHLVDAQLDGGSVWRPGARDGRQLQIVRAVYGAPSGEPDKQVDVTALLQSRIQGGRLTVAATNRLAGDPARLTVKRLQVEYLVDGERATATVNENETLAIPEAPPGPAKPPTAQLRLHDGQLTFTAWEPARLSGRTAADRRVELSVTETSPPLSLGGPWELHFPPGWGAPEKTSLPKLLSWTECEDTDIRHFSGTATYVKEFDLAPDRLGSNTAIRLNLGEVQVLAQVKLNGHELGILWKPPFVVDLAGAARPGRNRLEVEVTNLWVNRLIGDEAYPASETWSKAGRQGGGITEIPQWLLTGGARPPTQRRTFATWRHYSAKSPLLPSGLLGPVQVEFGVVRSLG